VLKTLAKEKPTLFPGVPRIYIALNEAPETKKYDLHALKACVSGAAPLPMAVAQEFERFFGLMFNGGQVQMHLTDPDNVNVTGIDILAQPPGKRLQALPLLSGGERALVATALLFAILTAKPVPFCLLDEVDAALDEANVKRFCQALKSVAEQTQFVVITHNRETMAIADALYGVSMSQDGVSRLVSLRLPREDRWETEDGSNPSGRLTAATPSP